MKDQMDEIVEASNAAPEGNASECDTSLKKKKRPKKIRKKDSAIAEIGCTTMQQSDMNMGSPEKLMETNDKMNGNLGSLDNTTDHIIKNESETNLPSKDGPLLNLAEHPELDANLVVNAVSEEKASDCNTSLKNKKRQKKIRKKDNDITKMGCTSLQQTEMNMGSPENLMGIKDEMNGNLGELDNTRDHVVKKESETNLPSEDVPMLNMAEHPELDAKLMVNAVSEEKVSDCNSNLKSKKRPRKSRKKDNDITEIGCTSLQQTEMTMRSPENLMEIKDQMNGNLGVLDNTRDHVVNKESEIILPSEGVPMLNMAEHPELDAKLMVNAKSEDNASDSNTSPKKKKKQKKIRKDDVISEIGCTSMEIKDQMDCDLVALDNTRDHVVKEESETNLPSKDMPMLNPAEHPESDSKFMVNVSEGTQVPKMKKRKRKANEVNVQSEVEVTGRMLLNTGTKVNVTEIQQSPIHSKPCGGSTQSALVMVMNEVESRNGKEMSVGTAETKDPIEHHAKPANKINDCNVVNNLSENKSPDNDATLPLVAEHPGSDCVAGNTNNGKRMRRVRYKKRKRAQAKIRWEIGSMNPADAMFKILQSDDFLVPGTAELSKNNSTDHNSVLLPDVLGISSKVVSKKTPLATSFRRKLLVLDVNGLLACIVMPAPKDRRGQVKTILGRAIFKRPFCDDFLDFCFQNFDVGIWSSRSKVLIERVVDYLLGDRKNMLQFCWNMSQATPTGFKTLENHYKPLVCKELRKIWENTSSDSRWKEGDYDESNTLLLDDSPYKALLNPLHTAIFPQSFHYEDDNDKSLGPGGDLRLYLEGLLVCDNVRKYVEENPFGQGAINETNPSWEFYSGVLQTLLANNSESKSQELPPTQNQEPPPLPSQEPPPLPNKEPPLPKEELPQILKEELPQIPKEELPHTPSQPMPNQELPHIPKQELPSLPNQEQPHQPNQELPHVPDQDLPPTPSQELPAPQTDQV